jgi:hypothetical protein
MLEKVAADTVSRRGTAAAQCVFGPDVVTTMSEAYHAVLQELRIVDREDAGTLMVAKYIVKLARRGERDVQRLAEATLEALSR